MAARDIRAYRASRGAHFQVSTYPMASGASFSVGEPIVFNGAGAVTRATTDPPVVVGISAFSSTDTDGAALTTGARISVVEADDSQLWLCTRFATDGAGTSATPTQANAIGKTAGFTLSGSTWAVDTGAANQILRIEDVLDTLSRSITGLVHGTGFFVIFRFLLLVLALLLPRHDASAQATNTVPPACTVAQLTGGTCAPAKAGTRVRITNSSGNSDCTSGTGALTSVCEYDGAVWQRTGVASSPTARVEYYVTTLTGAAIEAAIDSCKAGGVACDIKLGPGTFTNVCLAITNTPPGGIRMYGAGMGRTILQRGTTSHSADDCVAITTQGQMVELNNANDVELSDFTLDGNKSNLDYPTCNASDNCGFAIYINSPSNLISNRVWIHRLEIKNHIGGGIAGAHVAQSIYEQNLITHNGCFQTADAVGDEICGGNRGAGDGGWTGAGDVGGTAGLKSKGNGILTSNGLLPGSQGGLLIQDNTVIGASYVGIEVFNFGEEDRILGNYVQDARQGMGCNGCYNSEFAHNRITSSGLTGLLGDNGVGLIVTGGSQNVYVHHNFMYSNDGDGMQIKPTSGGMGFRIEHNYMDSNCVTHNGGAFGSQLDIGGTATLTDLSVIDNQMLNNSSGAGCTYGLSVNSGIWTGIIRILGNYISNSGTSGAAHILVNNATITGLTATGNVDITSANAEVSLLNITGNLTYNATTTGLAWGNAVSGSTTNNGTIRNRGSGGRNWMVANGTSALNTGNINAGACAAVVTTAATGTLTTDAITWSPNNAPTAGTNGSLIVHGYPTANNVNFLVCNPTAGIINAPAETLNWQVYR